MGGPLVVALPWQGDRVAGSGGVRHEGGWGRWQACKAWHMSAICVGRRLPKPVTPLAPHQVDVCHGDVDSIVDLQAGGG